MVTKPQLRWVCTAVCELLLLAVLLCVRAASVEAALVQQADDTRCRLVMFHSSFDCTTHPGAAVVVSLLDDSGTQLATGEAAADARNGSVHIQLTAVQSGGRSIIRPGDLLQMRIGDTQLVHILAPQLAADVTASPPQVHGLADADTIVSVFLGTPFSSHTKLADIAANSEGKWEYSLDQPMDPGELGYVSVSLVAGHEVLYLVGAQQSIVRLNASGIGGTASAGTVVTVEFGGDASRRVREVESVYDPSESAPRWFIPDVTIGPGTDVTVTYHSPVLQESTTDAFEVPPLRVNGEYNANEISGIAPPSALVDLEIGSLRDIVRGRAPIADVVEASGSGDILFVLPDNQVLLPGWAVVATINSGTRVEVVYETVLRSIRVSVYGSVVSGVVLPDHKVRVVLRSERHGEFTSAEVQSNRSGQFEVRFIGYSAEATVPLLPGDELEIEVGVRSDPVFLRIPPISVSALPELRLLSGQGPANWEVMAQQITPNKQEIGRAVIDGQGRFEVEASIMPGMMGTVEFASPIGDVLEMEWSALQLHWEIGYGGMALTGNAAHGSDVAATLVDNERRTIADCRRIAYGRGSHVGYNWRCGFEDSTGLPVTPAFGDLVEVAVGDERVTSYVPDANIHTDIHKDSVSGYISETGAELIVAIQHDSLAGADDYSRPVSTVSGPDGSFSVSFLGEFDVSYNDRVFVSFDTAAGHKVRAQAVAEGLVIDLDSGLTTGGAPASSNVVVELLRDGQVRYSVPTSADAGGAFSATFSSQGQVFVPEEGDTVRVRIAGTTNSLYELSIPRVLVEIDPDKRIIAGEVPRGSVVALVGGTAGFRRRTADGTQGVAIPAVDDSGRFSVSADSFEYPPDTISPLDLKPGQRVWIRTALQTGHQIIRSETIPIVNVGHGTSVVCGFGNPGEAVSVQLRSADGEVLATSRGSVGWDRMFNVELVGEDGPVPITTGQLIVSQVGDYASKVVVPGIGLNVDWTAAPGIGRGLVSTRVSGSGPASTDYYLSAIEVAGMDCFAGAKPAERFTVGRTASTGEFSTVLDRLQAGRGLEIAFFEKSGHRIFQFAGRTRMRIRIYTNQIEGEAQPLSSLVVTAGNLTGRVRARAIADVGPYGHYSAEMLDENTEPWTIQPGDLVSASGALDDVEVSVPRLNFDYSDEIGIIGSASPDEKVRIDMQLSDGRLLQFILPSDSEGSFGFAPEDLPLRRDWGLAQVATISASIVLADGHEAGVTAVIRGQPDHLPRIFIPSLVNRF